MSWLGIGIGAGLGFALGGPIGAAIGACLGGSMGGGTRGGMMGGNYQQGVSMHKQKQTLFFVSLFSMLGKMAKADGVVSKEEINTVTNFINRLNLDAQDRQVAMDIFNNAKTDAYSIYDYADQYKENVSIEMREMTYRMLWEVAYSDGVIHEQEDAILKQMPFHLGLNNSLYESFRAEKLGSRQDIEAHYKLLGCSSTDTDAQIKQGYRRTVAEYHPDKMQSKGLPKEFIEFANEQTKKVNKAYDTIKKTRASTVH